MGADLPDDPDVPPNDHADSPNDAQAASGNGPAQPANAEAEPPSREEYAELYVAASQATAEEQAANDEWAEKAEESRWMWSEYQRRFPPEDHPHPDHPDDDPGSWREGDMYLKRANNERVEAACDQIAAREEEEITPALRAIESQDPDRHLIGLEHCRKGRDRIKEKVCRAINNFGRSPEQAVSQVPDTIRYTFQYQDARYTQGVWADIERLKDQGFKLDKLKNSWSDEQYKGINSQWIEPHTGQRFEMQFHTLISFEAKQLTHDAYKRIRTQRADKFEQMVLEAFQRKVTNEVPVPPGASAIPDYPQRGTGAR